LKYLLQVTAKDVIEILMLYAAEEKEFHTVDVSSTYLSFADPRGANGSSRFVVERYSVSVSFLLRGGFANTRASYPHCRIIPFSDHPKPRRDRRT
jgi:hypothetical protein